MANKIYVGDELISSSDIDASNVVSGTLASARLPAGTVKQVVFASTSTEVVSSTNSYVDTGLTATITPTSESSRVLVIVSQSIVYGEAGIRVLRGATIIHEPVGDTSGPYEYTPNGGTRASITLVDSPNSASATVYKTTFRRYSSAANAAVQPVGTGNNGTSYITLIEVA